MVCKHKWEILAYTREYAGYSIKVTSICKKCKKYKEEPFERLEKK